MTERLAGPAGIERAARILARGGLVAFPTDTVHGLGCRPGDDAALARIYELKRRPAERRVPMLVTSLAVVEALGYALDGRARELASRYWPGPLTLVLREASGAGTQAFRVPAHPVALELLAAAGPLLTTSANLSGEPECWTTSDVLVAFAGSGDLPDAVLEGDSRRGVASSVLDLSITPARLHREGALAREELARLVEIG